MKGKSGWICYLVLALGGCAIVLAACSNGRASSTPGVAVSPDPQTTAATPVAAAIASATATPPPTSATLLPLDAARVYAALRRRGLPVSDGVQSPCSAADLPSGVGVLCISRVDFLDTTLAAPGSPWSLQLGGAIEVFATSTDACRVKRALDTANHGAPAEYDYLDRTILLRLSTRLPAQQVSAYELTVKRAVAESSKRTARATPTPAPARQP
jgi:hypothetical protein